MTASIGAGAVRHAVPSIEARCAALASFIDGLVATDPSLPSACRAFVRGGKRLRARLMFACGAASSNPEQSIQAAAAIEFFHAASLVHDDIVDSAESRRHAEAIHRTLGVRGAGLGGWYLGQIALTLIGQLPADARQLFAEAGQATSRGQLTELTRAWDVTLLPEERLAIMEQKTAAVFGVACELGGLLTGASEPDCARLRCLGEAFGMLFQIADDVDDLYGSYEELGRAPGADLAAGVISLLGTYGLQSYARCDVAPLLSALPCPADDTVADCRALMRSCGALDATLTAAQHYAESARGHLSVLRADGAAAWMASVVEATLARVERHAGAPH